MLNERNQIHNFISSSGSETVINYGSGSDFLTSSGSGSGSTTLMRRHYQFFFFSDGKVLSYSYYTPWAPTNSRCFRACLANKKTLLVLFSSLMAKSSLTLTTPRGRQPIAGASEPCFANEKTLFVLFSSLMAKSSLTLATPRGRQPIAGAQEQAQPMRRHYQFYFLL